MNIIQQLKDNEKPFGLMSEEMQAKMDEIGIENFIHGKEWCVYVLHPDYAEEPKIEECEITEEEGHLHFRMPSSAMRHSLHQACDHREFLGFKFSDGQVWNSPINYSFGGVMPGFRTTVESIKNGRCVVLHATHVLFRRQK